MAVCLMLEGFSLWVYVFAHMLITCMWRPEVGGGCLLQTLSSSVFETGQ